MCVGRTFSPAIGVVQSASAASSQVLGISGRYATGCDLATEPRITKQAIGKSTIFNWVSHSVSRLLPVPHGLVVHLCSSRASLSMRREAHKVPKEFLSPRVAGLQR